MLDVEGHIETEILTPLCYATEQTLQPLLLRSDDRLEIDVDDELEKFITQSATYDSAGERGLNGGNPSWAAINFAKRAPERKDIGYGKWLLAATDFSALVIHHAWPADRLVFKSPEAETLYRYLLARFFTQTRRAVMMAEFKTNGVVPEMPDDFLDIIDVPLLDHQKVVLAASLGQEAFALFMQQGTGKTAPVIHRVNIEAHRKATGQIQGQASGLYRCLVICPQSVRMNWQREFPRFSARPGKLAVLRGDLQSRCRRMIDAVRPEADCEWTAAIISTDSVESTMELLSKIPWDLVVLDESHYIKNHRAKRSLSCISLNSLNVRARMVLTGTPIANTVFDLWAQFEFLGRGLSGFSDFANFRGFHGKFENRLVGGNPIQKLIGVKSVALIQERLARLCFMATKAEVLKDLPAKVYDIIEVEMTALQRDYYRQLAESLAIKIEARLDSSDGESEVTVNHMLTMLLRLAQITSGFIKTDDTVDPLTGDLIRGEVRQISPTNPKVSAVVEMLTDAGRDPKGKTVIWSNWVEDIRAISARLADLGIIHTGYHTAIHKAFRSADADAAVREFNCAANCRVLIANPGSAREGLNMVGYDYERPDESDTYTDHEIYVSCDWSMIKRSQSEDRAHRRGTRSNVRITDLMVPGTIDEEIRARVMAKIQKAMMIQDVREILGRLLQMNGA